MKRSFSVLNSLASSWLQLTVVTVVQLVQVPIALSYLGKEEFGLFALLTQFLTTLMLMELGVTSALARLLIDGRVGGPQRYKEVWSSGLCVLGIQGCFLFLVIAGVSPFLSSLFNIPPSLTSVAPMVFTGVGLCYVIGYVGNIFRLSLFADQRMAVSNLTGLAGALLQFAVFVWAIRAGFGLTSYVVSLATTVPMVLVSNYLVSRKYHLNAQFSLRNVSGRELWGIFRLGLDVFVAGCFNIFITSSLLLFAGTLLPLSSVAVLAVNAKIPMLLVNLFQRIPGSAEPALAERISAGDLSRFRFAWALTVKFSAAIAIAGAGCYYLWGRVAVSLWTSPQMTLGPLETALLALIPLRFLIHCCFVAFLSLFKELRRVRWALLIEAAVHTVLCLLLGRFFGLAGLLLANVGSVLTGSIWHGGKVFCRLGDISSRELSTLLTRTLPVPAGMFLLLVLFFDPPAELLRSFPSAVITLVWLACILLSFWFLTLANYERTYLQSLISRLSQKLRKRTHSSVEVNC